VNGPEAAPRRTGGALAVGAGILLSRVFGLVRQRVISHFLGVGDASDVLSAALRIPNVLQNLLGEGVLSASFVPVYARLRAEGRDADAGRLARAVFAALAIVSSVVVLLGMLAAPWLVTLIAAGFSAEKQAQTVELVRILFPGMGLLALAAWCLGVLNAHRRYLLSYAAPVLWNVAIITAVLWGGSVDDQARTAWLVAVGAVVGSVLQFAVQVPVVLRVLTPSGTAPVRAELQVVRANFAPVVLGRGVVQVSGWVDQLIASLVMDGAAAVLFFAQNIAMLPVSVFGMSVSVTELTDMAERRAEDVATAIRERLDTALRSVAYFVVPSSAALILLGDVIAGALLQSGSFGRADTIWVWAVLAGASVGLLAGTMGRVYNSAWYALHDTRTPVRIAVIRIVIAGVLGSFGALALPGLAGFDARWGVAALTASAGIGAWVEFALLRSALNARVGATGLPAGAVIVLWNAAVVAGAAAFGVKLLLPGLHPVALGAVVLPLFGGIYFALTLRAGVPEARTVLDRVRARFGSGSRR